jgi:hypothetical protein
MKVYFNRLVPLSVNHAHSRGDENETSELSPDRSGAQHRSSPRYSTPIPHASPTGRRSIHITSPSHQAPWGLGLKIFNEVRVVDIGKYRIQWFTVV